jgi:uncharacterized protein YbjT (DUF2867 family)
MAQKKFLVTGATGDTGGYTVEQLLERGRAGAGRRGREFIGSTAKSPGGGAAAETAGIRHERHQR